MTPSIPPITHTSWKRVSKRGEGATAQRVGAVALQQAVEAETPGGGAHPDRERGGHEPDRPADERAEQGERRGKDERRGDDHLLALGLAGDGREDHADEATERGRRQRDAEPEEVVLEGEGGEEREEADAAAEHRHRTPGEEDARLVQLRLGERVVRAVFGARVDAFGILKATIAATANTTAPTRSDQSAPKRCWTPAAGMPPTVAARTLISARRELALTSSDLSLTTAGTSALLAIE